VRGRANAQFAEPLADNQAKPGGYGDESSKCDPIIAVPFSKIRQYRTTDANDGVGRGGVWMDGTEINVDVTVGEIVNFRRRHSIGDVNVNVSV